MKESTAVTTSATKDPIWSVDTPAVVAGLGGGHTPVDHPGARPPQPPSGTRSPSRDGWW